jgi:hypothetical protein
MGKMREATVTVFAVHPINNPGVDLSAALRWGGIVYVNDRYINGDELNGQHLPPEFLRNMQNAANRFIPGTDYLLIAGDHLQLVQMSAYLGMAHAYFRVLRWDRREQAYFPAQIDALP